MPLSPGLSRRTLLTTLAAGALGSVQAVARPSSDQADELASRSNGDAERIGHLAAVHTKGLPHDGRGVVDAGAWDQLHAALRTGDPQSFEKIPLGGWRRLANPMAAFVRPVLGPGPESYRLAAAPRLDSAEQAAELIELAWLALLRDVPFAAWDRDELVAAACRELSALDAYRGPREGSRIDGRVEGAVTPTTLARGDAAGELVGPCVSQLLLKDVALRPLVADQRFASLAAGADHATDAPAWRSLVSGRIPGPDRFDETPRYPRSGRDLAAACRRDLTYQVYFCAASTLLAWGTPIDGGNPYRHSRTQAPFATWGAASLLNLLGFASDAAFAACWFEKWRVHRRARPEELAGKLEMVRRGVLDLPMPPGLFESEAIDRLRARHDAVFLPQAYAEGCPLHPSYPAGHAVVAGACVTVLKAFFDESWPIPEPVVAGDDGLALAPWTGPDLSVGGELDKLAANLSYGRGWAGIHWRSDTREGLLLGERVATEVLKDLRATQPELIGELSFEGFDGARRVV